MLSESHGLIKQESQSDNCEQPNRRKDGCNPVQVALRSCRPKRSSTGSTKHVREPSTLSTVEQNAHNEGQHRDHVQDEGDVHNNGSHEEKSYRPKWGSTPRILGSLQGNGTPPVSRPHQPAEGALRPRTHLLPSSSECGIGNQTEGQ